MICENSASYFANLYVIHSIPQYIQCEFIEGKSKNILRSIYEIYY